MPRKWQARYHPHALMAAISDLMPIMFITRRANEDHPPKNRGAVLRHLLCDHAAK